MPSSSDKVLYVNINSTGWIFATVIFLMLVFVMAIVNSIFFIRIYNQSKDRDSGTGISGLSVTGSLVIGIVSIIIGVISFGWSLYLISKIYKNRNEVNGWWKAKVAAAKTFYNEKIKKANQIRATAAVLQSNGMSGVEALSQAERICGAPDSGFIRDPSMGRGMVFGDTMGGGMGIDDTM